MANPSASRRERRNPWCSLFFMMVKKIPPTQRLQYQRRQSYFTDKLIPLHYPILVRFPTFVPDNVVVFVVVNEIFVYPPLPLPSPVRGCEGTPHPGMPQVVLKKTEEAIGDSDIVLFMVDARQGVTESDRHYARYARKAHKM